MDRRTGKVCLVIFLVFLPGITNARILNVPEYPYTTIQSAIDAANDGDTISVWCESVPPRISNEYLLCNKSLFIVNRSFLPGRS